MSGAEPAANEHVAASQREVRAERSVHTQRAVLWSSAAALGTMILAQALLGAPPIGGGGSAHAGMVSQTGQHTILTSDASNEDVLLVLDGRNEELFVYRTDTNKGIQLYQRLNLPMTFADARARSGGR